MGDRISISFKNGEWESVVFFSHWDGRELLNDVKQYMTELLEEQKGAGSVMPLDRLEPCTVMLDFIRWFFKDKEGRVTSNYYLGKDDCDGDNSDNGHWTIFLEEEGYRLG